MTPRRALAAAAAAVAVALPIALAPTSFHWVPLAGGGAWRGAADLPGALRVSLALAAGGAVALALRRQRPGVRWALGPLALAAAPLVPLGLGRGALLLVFQGPVLVLVAAGSAALALARSDLLRRLPRPGPAALFALAAVGYALLGLRLPGPAGPQGDEPHYLVMTHSLLSDGDLDLADEFAGREYLAFFPGTLGPHASPASPPGRVHSIHAPGLPALLLPAYALGGYPGVRLFTGLLAALTAALAYRNLRPLAGDGPALAAWAALALVPPLPFFAVAVYPELPAALATALFLGTARGDGRPRDALLAGAAAAALPWLHPKLLPLAALGLGLTLWRGGRRAPRLAAAALLAVSLGALLFYFHVHYGRASLAAAYGSGFSDDVSLARVPWGAPALLFDRQFGLLAVAPLWALAAPGALRLLRSARPDALRALLLAAATLGVGASFSMWWGGACPPARFVVPALPALAALAAPALRARPGLAAFLGGVGAAVVGLAAAAPRAIHNRPDGQSGLLRFLAPALDLDPSLPSFVTGGAGALGLAAALAVAAAAAWRFRLRGLLIAAAGYVALAAGLRERPLVEPRGAGLALMRVWDRGNLAGPGLELERIELPLDLRRPPWELEAGEILVSRRLDLPPGRYRVRVDGRATGGLPGAHVVRIELTADPLLLAREYVQEGQPPPAFELLLPAGARRLQVTGRGEQGRGRIEGVSLSPRALVPRRLRGDFPWPHRPDQERYRRGVGGVRATALGGSLLDGEGFRLDGPRGAFLVEAPLGAEVTVRLTPGDARRGDELVWGERRLPLGGAAAALHLPADAGVALGDTAVVPVRLRSRNAWIAFSPAGP